MTGVTCRMIEYTPKIYSISVKYPLTTAPSMDVFSSCDSPAVIRHMNDEAPAMPGLRFCTLQERTMAHSSQVQRTPVSLRAMTRRWISLVPS